MYDKFIIEKNKKFIRYSIKYMTLEDLYSILTDPIFSHCFIVVRREQYLERFRIHRPDSKQVFLDKIEGMLFKHDDSGVDSDCFSIYDAEYLDCYPI